MRYAAIAAIAITLIIAVPIILGYGLASDEETYTKTSNSDATSITDALLNNESDYFIEYGKSNNNSGMLQRVTAQGDNYYIYASPDYVSTGSNYSSIPAYTTTAYTSTPSGTIDGTLTETITSGDPNAVVGYGLGNDPSDYWSGVGVVDIVYGYHNNHTQYVSITSYHPVWIYIDGVADTNYQANYPTDANGISATAISSTWDSETDTYTFSVNGTLYTGDWAYICCFYNGTGLWNQYAFDTIAPTDGNGNVVEDWTFTMEDMGMVKVTYDDDTVEYMDGKTVSHTANYTIVDDDVINGVKSVGISHLNSCVLSYYIKSSSSYADPAYGWYNAESDYTVYYNAWYNTYQNAKVTMYAHFEGNGQVEFYEGFSETSPLVTIKRANEEVSVITTDYTVYTLGQYEYVQIIFDTNEGEVTVNGLASMPSFGASPNVLNTITISYEFDGYIEMLKIVDQFTTILPVTAENYAENGESTTVVFPRALYQYNMFALRNSNGDWVTSGWSANWSGSGSAYVTFTPTSLADGFYTLIHYSPQINAGSVGIYVGELTSIATSPIAYRVDTATIVAGDYPSTVDLEFDIWSLFPNDDVQKIYINSIGVYGDSIRLATRTYNVNNGSINVTDIETGNTYTVKLLKSTITIELDDDGYYNMSINNIPIAHGAVAQSSTIYFGGEWSLTATRSTVVEETAVKTSWVPGEFALDKDGFVLAMVLTAAAAFVVLGMTGARSGAKVGLLALICGGACAIGLMML